MSFFSREVVAAGLTMNMAIGYTDAFPRPVRLEGLPFQSWIRTHFFLVPAPLLQRLLPLAVGVEDKRIFSRDRKEFFAPDGCLSADYQRYLRCWLFGEQDPEGEFAQVWPGARRQTKVNLPEIRQKTRAILSEHYLSARLWKFMGGLVAVNDLAGRRAGS